MLINGNHIENLKNISCQYCIVGAGAAGISLALELAKNNFDIILIEAGSTNNRHKNQKLYSGTVNNPARHLPPDADRHRCIGGTTALWGGRCIPFDAIDFEKRDFVPHSGWPISYKDLLPYYKQAHNYCECGEFNYNATSALLSNNKEMIPGFNNEIISTETIERWSPPTHFGKAYAHELKKIRHLKLFYNSVCTNITTDSTGELINRLTIQTYSGNQFYIHPKTVILAGGGLETTRLLMSSNKMHSHGIGNHSNWLGKGYMCHIHGSIARIKFRPELDIIFGYEVDRNKVYCRRRLWFTEQAQLKHQLLNSYMLLDRPLFNDPEHGSGIMSLAFFMKKIFQNKRQNDIGKGKYSLYWRHLKNIVSGSPEILSVLPKWSRARFVQGRRIPSLLLKSKTNSYNLYYQTEQIPSLSNTISLSNQRDKLGMFSLNINYNILNKDIDSIYRSHKLLATEIKKQQCGELIFNSDSPKQAISDNTAVLGHHLGTTRMANNPADGVVDKNCKVHNINNLYIASGSVFPTSSQANPTLTIVALSLRLAEYLKQIESQNINNGQKKIRTEVC